MLAIYYLPSIAYVCLIQCQPFRATARVLENMIHDVWFVYALHVMVVRGAKGKGKMSAKGLVSVWRKSPLASPCDSPYTPPIDRGVPLACPVYVRLKRDEGAR